MSKTKGVLFSIIFLSLILFLITAVEAGPWEKYDFGGETLHIRTRWGNLTPLGARGDFHWGDPDARLEAHIEEIEQMFNVTIDFITEGEPQTEEQLRTDILAGDSRIDVFHTSNERAVELILDGLLLPLDDILDEDFYASLPPELGAVRDSFTIGGQTYAFASPHRLVLAPHSMYWNIPLFEREGLPDLYELHDEGNWTWDELLEIARQTTRDTTGDGEIDQFGMTFPWTRMLTTWPATNGFEWLQTKNGRTEIVLNDPRMIETLEFLQQLHDEGLVGSAPVEERVLYGPSIGHQLTNMEEFREAGFGMIPAPLGPSGEEYRSIGPGRAWGAVIPVSTNHEPKAIVEVMAALWQTTEPYIDHMSVYRDMEHWREDYWHERELVVPDAKTLEIWHWNEETVTQPFDATLMALTHWDNLMVLETIWNDAVIDGQSPAAVLSQVEPVINSMFEDYRELYE